MYVHSLKEIEESDDLVLNLQYSICGVYLFSAFCVQNAVEENIEDMP